MAEEIHISSLVVHCRPVQAGPVAARIGAMPGMEVVAGLAEGKLVVVLETSTEGEILDRLDAVQRLDGVLAATLVFHQFETAQAQ
jgi:nitrate reductase NapD